MQLSVMGLAAVTLAVVLCMLTRTAAPTAAQIDGKCPSGWLGRDNSQWCYQLVNNEGSFKNWQAAKQACEVQHGYLLSIADIPERQWLARKINAFANLNDWWLGLEKSSGSWRWVDGRTGDEEPGNRPNTGQLLTWFGTDSGGIPGNCMSITEDKQTSDILYVYPRDCNKNARYICKKQKQDETTCNTDDSWELHNGRCYKAFSVEDFGTYWGDARAACNKLESDLASVGDQATNMAIKDMVNKNTGTRTTYWIGLRTYASSSDSKGYVWKWTDETPLTYQAWESGGSAPSVSQSMISNTCVQTVGNTEARLWRTYACNGAKNGYLCSMPTGTCASGWFQHRDYCYSINPRLLSWNQADATCASYGATLVQIKREHVQTFINEYREDFVKQGVDYIWLGLYRSQSDRGEIRWTTTGDLASAGYTNWADGEPKLDDSRANAGRIYAGNDQGSWQVANPVEKGGFVCQVPLGKTPLVPTTVYPRFFCPDDWLLFGRNCYKLETTFADWLTAQDNCRKYPGGGLIDIRDASEQEFIQGQLDPKRDYWIGLHSRTSVNRQWTWSVDETPATYFNWLTGEPNNHEGEENCVEMYTSGFWNDNRCTYRLSYICKAAANPSGSPPTLPPTTTVNFDPFCGPLWTRDLTSNFCYMFNMDPLIWFDAKHHCEYQGGKLLSIVTQEEKAYIAARMQAIKEADNGVPGFWTGFNDRAEEGYWVWDDITQPVVYLNWASGEPNNAGSGEDCAVMYADSAQWNDFACEKRYPSICKKRGNALITIFPPTTTIRVPDGSVRGCRDGYSGHNNMCYKVYTSATDELNWYDAKSKCQLDGGDLASVMNMAEQEFLQELAGPSDFNFWIGLYDSIALQRTMYFKWSDTSKPTFTHWFMKEPNNYGLKDDCVEIVYMWDGWNGRWNDQNCDVRRRFACKQRQIPVKVTQPVTRPYGCPTGYDDAYDGYCLKFVAGTERLTSDGAKSRCTADGGTLAGIPTANVQNHIFLRITEMRATGNFWIGLIQSGRTHVWDDGRRFTYSNWMPSAWVFGIRGILSPLVGMWDMTIFSSTTYTNYICQVRQLDVPTTIAPTTTYNPAYCASGWTEADGRCYKGFSVSEANLKLNWPEARVQCKIMNGDLASIHNEATMTALEQTVGGTFAYWIGLNTRDSNRGYVWADGTPADYFKWLDDKQPENINGNQNCALLNPSSMTWAIDNCNAAKNWLCETPKGIYPTGSTPEPTTPPEIPDCGDGWKYNDGFCYLLSSEATDWHNAEKSCLEKKADLASIHGHDENDFLLRVSSKLHISLTSYWIGLHELGQTSGFRWTDGTGANYFNWNTGEPNNAGGAEHCVAFYSSNGLWNDDQCGEKFRYICKRNNDTSRTEAPATVMPGKCPKGYFTVGNKCFRVYEDIQLQWSDARLMCEQAGGGVRGYLASISNEYEQAALTAQKTENNSLLWIGLFARYNNHQYYWHDNSPVSYDNWDYNEPNSVWEKCVHMYTEKYRAGKWNDAQCDRPMGFVCMTYKNPALVTDWQPPTTIPCEPGWLSYGTACFRYMPSATTWIGAEAACSTMGASLASIHDVWEQNFAHFTTESIARVSTWIGLADINSNRGVFQWSDKWPLTYTNWGQGQPNGGDQSSCVYLDYSGGWFTGDCNTRLPALCRKSFGPMPTTLPYAPGICPQDFVAQGDSCYFVANNSVSLTAQEAQYECQKRYRSNLVSILSDGEQTFVATLVRQKAQDEKTRSDYWIGLLRGSNGGFEWYDLNPLGFTYWSRGEPSNTPNENCVELYHINLRWNDHYCTKKNSYICKMSKLPATGAATTAATITTTSTQRTSTTAGGGNTRATPEPTTTGRDGQTEGPNGGLRSIADLRDDAVVAGAVLLFLALLAAAVLGVFFYRRRNGPKAVGGDTAGFSNANWSSSTNEVSLETGSSGGGGVGGATGRAGGDESGFANPSFSGAAK